MNSYDELIAAIGTLSEKSTFDYLIAIGPIVLSLIAIFISIYTTVKQNKIALLEKRCCVLETTLRIIGFSKNIASPENLYISDKKQHGKLKALELKSRRVCEQYNSMFGTNLDFQKKNAEKFLIDASLFAIHKDIMMARYLFDPEILTLLVGMSGAMAQYMKNTISQNDNSSYHKEFCEKCSEFKTKWLPKLEEQIRIK